MPRTYTLKKNHTCSLKISQMKHTVWQSTQRRKTTPSSLEAQSDCAHFPLQLLNPLSRSTALFFSRAVRTSFSNLKMPKDAASERLLSIVRAKQATVNSYRVLMPTISMVV
jgi:hypothetical protein